MGGKEERVDLPIVCSLTSAELAMMRDDLLPGLLAKASAKDSVPGGFRWRFEASLTREIAAVIDVEHRCCRFLRFVLLVEPGDGPVWLEVTGAAGTEGFLSRLLDAGSGTSGRVSTLPA
jgi:hypothetical protein